MSHHRMPDNNNIMTMTSSSKEKPLPHHSSNTHRTRQQILPVSNSQLHQIRRPTCTPSFHCSYSSYIIFVIALLLNNISNQRCLAQDPEVQFSTPEEMEVGSVLGSLGDDTVLPLGLQPDVRGSLRYSLLPQGNERSDLFLVDEDTGEISTRERIDRENLCGFESTCDIEIQVVVQSAVSQFFKKVKVTIRVDDLNDNVPTFPRDSTELHVSENAPVGTSFAIEGATDMDIGNNGIINYDLVPQTGAFHTNVTRSDGRSVVNLIVRQRLDRELVTDYSFTLQAVDGGQTPRTGSVAVRIVLDDINDNAPVFFPATYNTSLPETSVEGTKVIRVSATDQDTDIFGIKEYRFKAPQRDDVTDYFSIDPVTGQITTTGSLLQRQGQTFRLIVECLDKGLPPLVARAEVEVTVEDTINSSPKINLNVMFQGAVSEVAQSGTVVALLSVEDRDAGLNGIISCSIVSDAFELQPMAHNEYKVIVVRQLDREVEPTHDVSVMCQDAGTPPLADVANFTIKVRDENDKTPYFSQTTYRKSVQENNRVGQILLRVVAQDDDIGENARISFDLLDAPDSLRIDNRGNIIATESLDYETQRVIRFKVIATDNGKEPNSNTADVVIELTDINDETPTFEKTRYDFSILENNPANVTVNSVKATDKDVGINGQIKYSLTPRVSPFAISSTGVIIAKERLDREFKPSYILTVNAVDLGIPSNTGTAVVVINITDQNDHSPRIWFPKSGNTSVPIAFDMKPNSVVFQIQAEDRDSGDNKRLEYHLAASSGRSMFRVNKTSGELILKRRLTMHDEGKHRLTVVVIDKSASSPLASNSSFDVIVFAPNHTTARENDNKETEHVIVVIILGVITGVVTVAVIITIVVIRRADRQRRKYLQSRTKMPPDSEKFEENPMGMEVGYVISNDPLDGTNNTTTGGGGSNGTKPPRGGSKSDESSRDVTQDEGFADKSFNTSHGSNGPTDQTEWSKALRLHQDLLKLHGVDSAFLMQGGAANLDDVTSDGSGESTTCDSGRGGSEEDNHSHGRASPANRGPDSFMNNLNQPTTSNSTSRSSSKPNGSSSHRSQPNNTSFLGSNSNNNNNNTSTFNPNANAHPKYANIPRTGGLPAHLQGRQLGHSLDANLPSNPRRSTSVPTVKHVSFRDDFRHEWPELLPPHRRGQGNNAASPGSSNSNWRPSRGGDRSLHSPSPHQKGFGPLNLNIGESFETGDDGNSTTTSGSYTVDDLSPRGISGPYLSPEQAVV